MVQLRAETSKLGRGETKINKTWAPKIIINWEEGVKATGLQVIHFLQEVGRPPEKKAGCQMALQVNRLEIFVRKESTYFWNALHWKSQAKARLEQIESKM